MTPAYTTSTPPAPATGGLADIASRALELRLVAAAELGRLAQLIAATSEIGSLHNSQLSLLVHELGRALMACDGLVAAVRLAQRVQDIQEAHDA